MRIYRPNYDDIITISKDNIDKKPKIGSYLYLNSDGIFHINGADKCAIVISKSYCKNKLRTFFKLLFKQKKSISDSLKCIFAKEYNIKWIRKC